MWQLDFFTTPDDQALYARSLKALHVLKSRIDLGFLKLPERENLWLSAQLRADEIRKNADTLVVLGMGGSSLGGRALLEALKVWNNEFHVEFIDNVDASYFSKWLHSRRNLERSHWVIISKSGSTIETLTMAEFIDQFLRQSRLSGLSSQATVISEEKESLLTNWARKCSVPILEIPKDVGGRYSVLSPVGLLPASFYGLNISQLKAGAEWALKPEQEELIARLVTQSLMSFQRSEWITLLWAYSSGLREFGLWFQQLWAESLGKALSRDGSPAPRVSTPQSAVGSSDQHSILQQVMEGSHDKFLWFLRIQEAEKRSPTLEQSLFSDSSLMIGKSMGQLFGAMADATREALRTQNVQSLTLKTEKLDEKSVGALFMLFQLVVGAMGEALNINAFDQPGVELGKKLAKESLNA